jgi:hypothetical protein
MNFTFDPALTTAKDRIRMATGDVGKRVNPTSDTDFSLQNATLADETYNAAITNAGGDEDKATVTIARNLMAQYAQMPDKVTIGPDTWDYGARLKALSRLISELTPGEVIAKGRKLVQLDPEL